MYSYHLADGSLAFTAFNETVNFTDTTTLCLSSDRKVATSLQPVPLVPGYVRLLFRSKTSLNSELTCLFLKLASLYIPGSGFSHIQYAGMYSGDTTTGSIYPQFCQFAACPNYTTPISDSSSSSTVTDTTLTLIVVFGTLFVLSVCTMCLIFSLAFVGVVKWQGNTMQHHTTSHHDTTITKVNVKCRAEESI